MVEPVIQQPAGFLHSKLNQEASLEDAHREVKMGQLFVIQ